MPSESEEDSGSDSLLTQFSQRFAGDDGDSPGGEGEEATQFTQASQASQASKPKWKRGKGTPRPSAKVTSEASLPAAEHTDEAGEDGDEATQASYHLLQT